MAGSTWGNLRVGLTGHFSLLQEGATEGRELGCYRGCLGHFVLGIAGFVVLYSSMYTTYISYIYRQSGPTFTTGFQGQLSKPFRHPVLRHRPCIVVFFEAYV